MLSNHDQQHMSKLVQPYFLMIVIGLWRVIYLLGFTHNIVWNNGFFMKLRNYHWFLKIVKTNIAETKFAKSSSVFFFILLCRETWFGIDLSFSENNN